MRLARHQRARYVAERGPQRGDDVNDRRCPAAERLVERRSDLLAALDTDAAAADGTRDRGEVHVGKRAGDRPISLPVFDPAERAVVEHDDDYGDAFVACRHEAVDRHGEATIASKI